MKIIYLIGAIFLLCVLFSMILPFAIWAIGIALKAIIGLSLVALIIILLIKHLTHGKDDKKTV